jgi:hypothetical protein
LEGGSEGDKLVLVDRKDDEDARERSATETPRALESVETKLAMCRQPFERPKNSMP